MASPRTGFSDDADVAAEETTVFLVGVAEQQAAQQAELEAVGGGALHV